MRPELPTTKSEPDDYERLAAWMLNVPVDRVTHAQRTVAKSLALAASFSGTDPFKYIS